MTHKNYCDQHTITSPFLIFHFFIVNIHQNWTPSLPRQKYLSPINSVIIHFQFSARFLNFQQFKNILFLPCFQFGRRDVIDQKWIISAIVLNLLYFSSLHCSIDSTQNSNELLFFRYCSFQGSGAKSNYVRYALKKLLVSWGHSVSVRNSYQNFSPHEVWVSLAPVACFMRGVTFPPIF